MGIVIEICLAIVVFIVIIALTRKFAFAKNKKQIIKNIIDEEKKEKR